MNRYDAWVQSTTSSKLDVILRIKNEAASPSRYKIDFYQTSQILQPVTYLVFVNDVLREALKNQWHHHKYTEEYVQLLLGQCTKEDFMEIAKQYAKPFNSYSADNLRKAVVVVCSALQEDISTEGIAQILHVDPNDVDSAFDDNDIKILDYQPD